MRTRAFRSGNSQAVRIPAEIAFPDMKAELEITRVGDIITIAPVANTLKEAIAYIRSLPRLEHEPLGRTQSRDTLWDVEDEGKQ